MKNILIIFKKLRCATNAIVMSNILLFSHTIQAANSPPKIINYQGYLVDSNKDPLGSNKVSGNYVSDPTNFTLRFRMYDAQSGGNPVWSEDQVVTIDNGYFNVYLGEINSISAQYFNNSNADTRFIGITVDLDGDGNFSNEIEIAPRLRLLSAPYALLAERAVIADKLTSSGAVAEGDLEIKGKAILGQTDISGTLSVSQKATLDSSDISGDLNVSPGNLTVGGNTTLGNVSAPNGTITANKFVGNGTIPIGGIIMWSGHKNTIPTGWFLCDGNNGTPNLTDRFIIGAGGTYNYKNMGGSKQITLGLNHIPDHQHDYTDKRMQPYNAGHKMYHSFNSSQTVWESRHSDPFNFPKDNKTTAGVKNRGATTPVPLLPPYFALCFIMRSQ